VVVAPVAISPSIDDEAMLIARAQGDRQAFAMLYRHYLPDVYRFCYRRLGNEPAAEDATSQVFTRALVALPRFESGSFRAWLFTIAHHIVIDEVRRTRPAASLEAAASLTDPAPTPEEALLSAEHCRRLAAVLRQLPPAQQQVLELRLAGLKAPEIATVLGRSHGTIRNLQHRALLRVRELLQPKTEEGQSDGA
jgi:RNA polymerase sigma-70 factor (ECF subfamily)